MGERFNQDSVYGGDMTPEQWIQAELEVSEEMPEWILPDVKGIKATIGNEEIILCRNNTMIFDFDTLVDEENGITYDFEWFSHIYIHRGDGKPPYWHRKPEDKYPEAQKEWDKLANLLIDIDCDYRTGIPKEIDFQQIYEFERGEEPMDDIIERIQDEGSQ